MKILYVVLAAYVAVGCAKVDLTTETVDRRITVSSSIEGISSKGIVASDSALTDIVFVRVDSVKSGLTGVNFSETATVSGSRATDGVITFNPTQQYDQESKSSYFVGYYPAGTLAEKQVTWSIDGSTDILVSDLWDAGNYEAPISTGLTFCHRLARLEVICLAESGSALSVVRSMWGTIDSVKLKEALSSMTFSYVDHSLAVAGNAIDFPLLDSAFYAGKLTPRKLSANTSTEVTAGAMVAPIDGNKITLRIKTSAKEAKEIVINLTDKFERAKIHKVTLTFKANGKDIECKSTTIEAWSTGTTGGGNVEEPTEPTETPDPTPEP